MSKKKFVAGLLALSMMVVSIPQNIYASQGNFDTYVSQELGVVYETFTDNNKIIINIKDSDGDVLDTLIKDDDIIYLNGQVVDDSILYSRSNTQHVQNDENDLSMDARAIKWGSWNYSDTIYIQTGGLTSAAIAGIIALKCSWTPSGVIATIAGIVAGSYDEISIEIKSRFGSDSKYQYYERITEFFGDGDRISAVGNPFEEFRKTPLDGIGPKLNVID